MTLEALVDALEAIEPYGSIIAIAGSISGTIALIRSAALFKKTREFRAHMETERPRNTVSLAGILRACRDTIAHALLVPDSEAYFRSLAAISLTLQTSLFQYEGHIAHNARFLVPILLRELLDASTVGHLHSIKMLSAVSSQVGILLDSIRSPPEGPR